MNAVDLPELLVGDAGEWRQWLSTHHADSRGVWLVLAKRGTVAPTTVSYDEALDEAICFGWIDGLEKGMDDQRFAKRFMRRIPKSNWTEANIERARKMIMEGKMTEAGRALLPKEIQRFKG